MNNLLAISPIDGRYHYETLSMISFFSESAVIHYRLSVEIEYLIALRKAIPDVTARMTDELIGKLREIPRNLHANALAVKAIEKETKHDVKAIEYFLANKLRELGEPKLACFVHIGLTSQDICSVALSMSLLAFNNEILVVQLHDMLNALDLLAQKCQGIAMLSRTHGQPASPTMLSKEIQVFWHRLHKEMFNIHKLELTAKFGGAVGNFNAHKVAFPNVNWPQFADDFVNQFGILRSTVTTQVDNNDSLVKYFDTIKRINNILTDFARDMWLYISLNYFSIEIVENEVGSSTMPHKINPIKFENAEGNLGLANALFEHIGSRIQMSRLQRDLTDSTVLRNVGSPLAYSFIAYNSLMAGIKQLTPNKNVISDDLTNNWMVIAEGIQTILRREGFENAYELLKDLTRTNERVGQSEIANFIRSLDISDTVRKELFSITPYNYTGV